MTIRKMLIISSVVMTLCLAACLGLMFHLKNVQDDFTVYQEVRFDSQMLADELRQSSDDLTRLARLFVTTNKHEPDQAAEYLREYNAIIAIRNGDVPRPVDYHLVYWDFAAVTGKNPTPDSGDKISLNDMMKNLNFTQEEFALLERSGNLSNDLVNLETMAINIASGKIGDAEKAAIFKGEDPREAAIRLLHSKEYMNHKANIMKPINEFMKKLDERTDREGAECRQTMVNISLAATVSIIIVVLIAAYVMVTLFRLVLAPIQDLTGRVHELSENGGDLTQRLPITKRNEISALANGMNMFLANIQSIIINVKNSAAVVEQMSEEIGGAINHTSEQMDDVSGITQEITAGMQETAAASEEMSAAASTVDETANTMSESADSGSDVATQIYRDANKLKDDLENAVSQANEVFGGVKVNLEDALQKSSSITQIEVLTESILDIAEQTNLLALNAAIEAARAGDAGRGFGVVAEEIRKLSEDSKETVERIQSTTRIVLDAVHNLTKESNNLLEFVSGEVMDDYERMQKGTDEYNRGIGQLNTVIDKFKEQADNLRQQMGEILRTIESVTNATNDAALGITNINSSTIGVVDDVNIMVGAKNQLEEQIENMNAAVGVFITE